MMMMMVLITERRKRDVVIALSGERKVSLGERGAQ